ncbi:MAG TPA: response regulator transcription factor [Sphingopyxis sp.]|nr:response regulator transcription factor [Sphingopyxis sp.]HMP46986.1 response regulator transcription factor [Sphingopyxis sp.]HMQ19688.1 response regulator transcription factor [Sphingopyxis sp.]
MFTQQISNNSPAPGAALPAESQPATILVVDDDPGMRAALLKVLRANGFHCLSAADGYEMTGILMDQDVDLILLDVMMPGISGFDLCRNLRQRDENPVPVIMISARGDEADKVTGLELGADDYIAKPFGESELLARIRAMLRRGRAGPVAAAPRVRRLRFGDWTVDLPQRQLFAPSGARVELSGAEYDLLLALLEHPQRVIGREPLLEMSRSRLGNASDRTIDVHICRLRRKLGDEEARAIIRTVRGVGYIFTLAVERV